MDDGLKIYDAFLSAQSLMENLLVADGLGRYASGPQAKSGAKMHLENAQKRFEQLSAKMAALSVSEPA